MYGPGQIVYDLDKRCPFRIGDDVWDVASYPKRHTHFIKGTNYMNSEKAPGGLFYGSHEIACPKTLKEARELMRQGRIFPAPCRPDHCWDCGNWKTNCRAFKTCKQSSKALDED